LKFYYASNEMGQPQQLSKEAKGLVEEAATHFLTVKPRRTSVKPYGPRPKKQKIKSGETSSTSDTLTDNHETESEIIASDDSDTMRVTGLKIQTLNDTIVIDFKCWKLLLIDFVKYIFKFI
jgi:hypothetical protein